MNNLLMLWNTVPKKKKLHGADLKARQLLYRYLTPTQQHDMRMSGWFHERGPNTGRIYSFYTRKFLANIIDKRESKKYCICIGDRYDYPTCDHVLAQLMMLRTNEKRFLQIANVTYY